MSKAKIKSLGELKKEAGVSTGGGDYADLETVKVSALAESGQDIVLYGAEEMESQYDEGTVYVVQIGDDKEPKAKFWTSHAALKHQLKKIIEHELFPCATKIVQRKSKSGRQYYDFEG